MYDPCVISPFVLQAKLILQELTAMKLGWDEPIAAVQKERWQQWLEDLQMMEGFKVNCCIKPHNFGEVKDSCVTSLFRCFRQSTWSSIVPAYNECWRTSVYIQVWYSLNLKLRHWRRSQCPDWNLWLQHCPFNSIRWSNGNWIYPSLIQYSGHTTQ